MKRSDYQQKKRKQSNRNRMLKIVFLTAVTLFLCLVTYGIFLQKKADNAIESAYEEVEDRPKSEKRDEAVAPQLDNISILLIGVDDSDVRDTQGTSSLSDALLVATLNQQEKTVKLLSIPRDSYVYLPTRGFEDKINHAHAFDGTKGSIEAVEGFLDIPIDYYIKMNFNAFIEVVDAVGGVEVEVPYDYTELDENDQRTVQLVKGVHHLDGRHALALARTRKLDSDVERGKRQQMILQAIIKEAFSVKSILKLGDVIDAVGDNMKTDMTPNEMKALVDYVKGGLPEITTLNLVGEDDWCTGTYYYKLNEESLEETIYELKNHLEISTNATTLTDKTVSEESNLQDEATDMKGITIKNKTSNN